MKMSKCEPSLNLKAVWNELFMGASQFTERMLFSCADNFLISIKFTRPHQKTQKKTLLFQIVNGLPDLAFSTWTLSHHQLSTKYLQPTLKTQMLAFSSIYEFSCTQNDFEVPHISGSVSVSLFHGCQGPVWGYDGNHLLSWMSAPAGWWKQDWKDFYLLLAVKAVLHSLKYIHACTIKGENLPWRYTT